MITNLKHSDKYNKKREAKYFSFYYGNKNYSNFIVRGNLNLERTF